MENTLLLSEEEKALVLKSRAEALEAQKHSARIGEIMRKPVHELTPEDRQVLRGEIDKVLWNRVA
jgi:hypothetical protein